MLLAHSAGAQLADLEFLQFHPTAVIGVPGREGFLITEAIRGEGATLLDGAGERFVDELAAARRGLARDRRAARADRRALGLARHARRRPGAVPEHRRDARRGRHRHRRRDLIPVAPAAHYMMGGIRTDLARALDAARALRGRRVGVHRPARRQPPRVQLAQRVLRVRRPRRARRARRAAARRAAPPAERAPERARSRRRRATALWRDAGLRRTREGLERLLDDPHPLARLIGACALGARPRAAARTSATTIR